MVYRCIGAALILLLLIACSVAPSQGGGSPQSGAPSQQDNTVAVADNYRIGPADLLQVLVWKNEGLSRTVPVRPDGMITLPLLNDVRAAGLTPAELRAVLIDGFGHYVSEPEVSVIVEEVNSYLVSVIGEVREPGRYRLRNRATVFDVVAEAGGFSEFASTSDIVILRNTDNSRRKIAFDYEDAVKDPDGQDDLYVMPGDIIIVP